ncbi:hypothetical protein PsYK624_066310 [Phanerochaete sordida]|uniref:Uncharacterized protein n=1 Tax=Phanerochaete sordida TaxID=48140 RepID=A0A9P3LDL5_9APHY|nr:hypothetical protein PsYK624_066310 [Phanerochaete sordida]
MISTQYLGAPGSRNASARPASTRRAASARALAGERTPPPPCARRCELRETCAARAATGRVCAGLEGARSVSRGRCARCALAGGAFRVNLEGVSVCTQHSAYRPTISLPSFSVTYYGL